MSAAPRSGRSTPLSTKNLLMAKTTAVAASTPLTMSSSSPSLLSTTASTVATAKEDVTARTSSSVAADAKMPTSSSLKPSAPLDTPATPLATPKTVISPASSVTPHLSAAADNSTSGDAQPRERGWNPVEDKRFRIALVHQYADRDDGPNAVTVDAKGDAAGRCFDEACHTPMSDALCNECRPTAPHIQVSVEAALVNSINNAYTSSGYPFVLTTGNTRGAVYGSFTDLRNPSLSSLELPPSRSIIIAPRGRVGRTEFPLVSGLTEMDTLLAISWCRGDRIMSSTGTASAASSQCKAGVLSGLNNTASSNSSSGGHNYTAGSSQTPAIARVIAHHLTQYPEGIHAIHSSPSLRMILVEGRLPTALASVPSAPVNAAACAPASASGGAGIRRASAPASAGTEAPLTFPLIGRQAVNAEANVPPLPKSPESNAPVQYTLVSASTFNHLSVYVVAHQGGAVLYTAAMQSLSVSIATRKVTAHQLILVGREEVDALEVNPLTPYPVKPPKRSHIAFADVPVHGEEAALFFGSKTARFMGADECRKTVSAAPMRFSVEPHLLIGNQNGDVFVFGLLQERVVQHINFGGNTANPGAAPPSGKSGSGNKVIFSPVSCIAELQNGIEKHITRMVEAASVAKRNGQASLSSGYDDDENNNNNGSPTGFSATADAVAPSHYYYRVPSSRYAIGFDDGQLLVVCVSCEGAWMLRHLNSNYFGLRPICAIAVRVPSFYVRLWSSYLPPITLAKETNSSTSAEAPTPITTLVTAESTLIVHDEEQLIAAISCNGGSISLVRLPDMTVISSVAPTDYNAVGEILALQWTATSSNQLLLPNVLVASGEDDTITAFQLVWQFLVSAVGFGLHSSTDNVLQLSSADLCLANARLCILEKKRFHRSWVTRLSAMPIVLPAAVATAQDGNGSSPPTGGGMPRYLGVCLLASSYDQRTSFWPYLFPEVQETRSMGDRRTTSSSYSTDSMFDCAAGQGHVDSHLGIPVVDGPLSRTTMPDKYVVVEGPTTAYSLHPELVLSAAAAGGGASFFMVTVCCRGKVMFWSLKVRL